MLSSPTQFEIIYARKSPKKKSDRRHVRSGLSILMENVKIINFSSSGKNCTAKATFLGKQSMQNLSKIVSSVKSGCIVLFLHYFLFLEWFYFEMALKYHKRKTWSRALRPGAWVPARCAWNVKGICAYLNALKKNNANLPDYCGITLQMICKGKSVIISALPFLLKLR